MPRTAYIGCAGWSLPRDQQPRFAADGSHLQRYASVFNAVEINSSFYRRHRAVTYARWANSVPETFRFSVKLPKTITHERRLTASAVLLDEFLGDVSALGQRLGMLLAQLPPSLGYQPATARGFFTALRNRYPGPVALEPRHASWFTAKADALLARYDIARVAADPPRDPADGTPGGSTRTVYYRLHGAPRIYYSSYTDEQLDAMAQCVSKAARAGATAWCVFDNTASGAATANALDLHASLKALAQ